MEKNVSFFYFFFVNLCIRGLKYNWFILLLIKELLSELMFFYSVMVFRVRGSRIEF